MPKRFKPKVRFFKRDDLEDVIRIEEQSFGNPWTRQMFTALYRINPSGFYVAENKRLVIGYAVVLMEPVFAGGELSQRAHLLNLAVHEGKRQMGVGSAILARIEKDSKKARAREVLLEVRRSNTHAAFFYSARGFMRIGSIRGFYGDEDAIVMSKKLKKGSKK